MSFRRIPFQFSTTDPVERQRELERRFGLPTNQNMYVDVKNPLSSGTVPRENSSPRLQHRVPIFAEGYDHPMNSSVDSMCPNPENKKPNVRVIPIEVEGADRKPTTRHRTYSGPAGIAKNRTDTSIPIIKDDSSLTKNSLEDLPKPTKVTSAEPRVFNIPIQIEGADNTAKGPKAKREKREAPRVNGCHVSKSAEKEKSTEGKEKSQEREGETVDPVKKVLTKIENVLEEFKSYEKGVQEFQGTVKEKQYRYLDEMLTRCMLRLDELDTMGNEELRMARKNAVKKIQGSIDLLESKANATDRVEVAREGANTATDTDAQDVEMKEQKDAVPGTDTEPSAEVQTETDVEPQGDEGVNFDSQSKDTSDVINESPCDVNEIEMSEGKDGQENSGESELGVPKDDEGVVEDKRDIEETLANSENSGASSNKEVLAKEDETRETHESPEVEMTEIVSDTPTKEPVKDINEVEMVDSTCASGDPKPDGVESARSGDATGDVEMNDLPPGMTEEGSPSIQSVVEQRENNSKDKTKANSCTGEETLSDNCSSKTVDIDMPLK